MALMEPEGGETPPAAAAGDLPIDNQVNESAAEVLQPNSGCTCLYRRTGTFDARSHVAVDYMNTPPDIRDPFCTYNHIRER